MLDKRSNAYVQAMNGLLQQANIGGVGIRQLKTPERVLNCFKHAAVRYAANAAF